MSEWKIVKLGDVITFQRGYDLPKTKMIEGIYPVIGSNGIIGYHNEFTTNSPSITIGRSGNVGKPFIYKGKSWSHNTTLFVKEFKNVYPSFIYYLLGTLNLNHYAGGTAVPTLNRNHIHNLEINLPPLETQKKIAAVLSALDDKIELNNAINKNLEEQAQAIYKNMFVDNFNLAWRSGTLSDIAEITNGKRPLNKFEKASEFASIPIFGASSIMGYTTDILCDKKILITGRVGTHGIIQRYNKPCWVSDNAFIITSLYYEYCFQILRSVNYKNLNRGSTQPLITQTDLKKLDVILPSEKILLNFEELVGSLMRVCDKNHFENQKLGELRDTLLPRLMSGEIDVSSIEI